MKSVKRTGISDFVKRILPATAWVIPAVALLAASCGKEEAAVTAAGFPWGSQYGDLFSSDAIEWFVGPAFRWDILHYGRIKNRVRVQDARLQELEVNYQNTVLKAAQEVEDAMAAFLRAQEEARFLTTTTGDIALNLVAMYKALGGGWEFRVGRDFVPAGIKEKMHNRTDWGRLLSPEAVETPSEGQRKKWRRPDC